MGAVREQQSPHIVTSFDAASGVLLARQAWSELFSNQVTFLAAGPRASSFTADRRAFWGSSNANDCPESLKKTGLDNSAGAGLDPCGALQIDLLFAPGEARELVFVFGQADSQEHALAWAQEFTNAAFSASHLSKVRDWWDSQLQVIQVETPGDYQLGAELLGLAPETPNPDTDIEARRNEQHDPDHHPPHDSGL